MEARMQRKICKAAVIGSGVMGSGIAAHLANVGITTYLLDIVPSGEKDEDQKSRNRLAISAIEKMVKAKPSPLYAKEDAKRIIPGNIEDDLHRVSEVDWIIEVVVENLQVKKDLFARLEPYWKPGTVVSSNTSGVSIKQMIEGCTPAFRSHFLGTHFFNPPRYMKLLEIIPNPDSDPEIVTFMRDFSERVLGKGVVIAKDTPNFVANRIGTYGLMVTLDEMVKKELSIEEVDALTGSVLGRPNSATYRTLDLVGLDTFAKVIQNAASQVNDPAEKEVFAIPDFFTKLLENGWVGDKKGQGFYKKVKSQTGSKIYALDYRTGEYHSLNKVKFASLERAKAASSLREKLQLLFSSKDKAGEFTWSITKRILLYAADKIGEIAEDIVYIDQAMKWGFNWKLGPFELWDLIGVEKSVARMSAEGEQIPLFVKKLLENGKNSFYQKNEKRTLYFTIQGDLAKQQEPEEAIYLDRLKAQNKTICRNQGASLIDLGDDVACLELHSPNQAIGSDIIQMLYRSLDEVTQNYRGLVIASQGRNFCVGANLMLVLMEIQNGNWDEIERKVKGFQKATLAMKYFQKPIVSAPYQMTLGGGTELCLPTAKIQAAAETYMGLVEVGVGLIPSGGGTKELLVRQLEHVDFDGKVDLQPYVNRTFETIAMAKVSTSAKEAASLGFLFDRDGITVGQDFLLSDAKHSVLALHEMGYRPKKPSSIRVAGTPGLAVLKTGIYHMKCNGFISEHDELIGKKLAYVLSGGEIPANSIVTESYLLDLEREAFLSLCGEQRTQERIQYMLLHGKPLRN
jgi:3-hydroxyacyl-CoA dehydrogenase